MTEAVKLNEGTGGASIVVDELETLNGEPVPSETTPPTGPVVQRMKVGFGPDGALRDVDAYNPLPIAGAVTISGVATASKQDTGNSTLGAILAALRSTLSIGGAVTVSNLPATQPVSGPLTNAELRASAVPVSGTVGVSGSVAVTGTFWQATQPISAASLPLPTGAATAALQTTGNATLTSILTALGTPLQAGGSVNVANFPATQAVSAASLPLPTGAATAANQATGNTSLANLDTDVGAIDAAPAAADGTGNYSLVAAAKRALLNWANLFAILPDARGQTTMAGSLSVALASDQPVVPVALPAMTPFTYSQTGVIAINTDLIVIDCQGFAAVSIHCVSMGTSGVASFAWSNDGIGYVPASVMPLGSGNPASTVNAAGIWNTPVFARYLRIRLTTATTGGTTTFAVHGLAQPGNLATLGQQVTIGATGNLVRFNGFTDSSTALGSAGVFTGTGRNTSPANYPWFRARALADQAGTLFIDCSTDSGATYRVANSAAVAANVPAEIVTGATGASGTATLYRVRYVNGGTAQGAFQLSSMFHA